MQRNRLLYLGLTLFTIAIGLISRMSFIPEVVLLYAGDILYATMLFFLFGFLFPNLSTHKVAAVTILLCYGIEILQLYQADWIQSIRATKIGGLILGHGFLLSDLVCYSIGGRLGWLIEELIYGKGRIED